MGEEDSGVRLQIRGDVAFVDALLHVVGEEDGDELCAAHRLGERLDGEPGILGGRPGRAPFAEPDLDVDAGVAQVERVGVTLAAVAEDGHLAGEEVDVAFAMDCCCHEGFLSSVGTTEDVLGTGAAVRGRPREPDPPRAGELDQAVRAQELLEGLELLRRAHDLEDHGIGAEVGDARVEDVGEGDQLRAPARVGRDPDERELALDGRAGLERRDAEDVHELVHLLLDLLEQVGRAVDREHDAGDVLALRRPDGEALDVEAPPREHVRDPGERARPVLDEDGDGVRHASTTSSSENSITSVAAAPAGIIGKHFSSGSVRASTTAVRPQEIASSSTLSRSSSDSTVKPAAP